MDRPPTDPVKLLSSWTEWETGETPAGRVISNLKTGGLRDVVEHLASEPGGVAMPAEVDITALLGTWMAWEQGSATLDEVARGLHDAGLRTLLEALVEAAVGAGDGGDDQRG